MSSLLEQASLVITPNAYKAGKLYGLKGTDLDVVRATTATRVNESGLIESVANNVPRLDYTGRSCPSILAEPQRTNLAQFSEQFNNAAWVKGQTTVTINTNTAPDGNISADTVFEIANTNAHNVASNYLISFVSGTSYTISIYAKNNTNGRGFLQIAGFQLGAGATNIRANFDLSNGTLGSINGGTATITEAYNGFYRLTFSFTCGNTKSERINYSLITSSTAAAFENYLGDSSKGIILWGAQLEEGSYATSYIPTVASAVTRNADLISKTGIADLIGQSEGTLFIDTYIDNISSQTNAPVLFYVKGSADVYIQIFPTGRVYGVFFNGSIVTGFINVNIGLNNGRHKMAFGYKTNDFVLYVNGVQVGNDTDGIVSGTLSEFGLQYHDNFYRGAQEINASALWKTKLTDTELATLTTL